MRGGRFLRCGESLFVRQGVPPEYPNPSRGLITCHPPPPRLQEFHSQFHFSLCSLFFHSP